jgi:hypothetical protein
MKYNIKESQISSGLYIFDKKTNTMRQLVLLSSIVLFFIACQSQSQKQPTSAEHKSVTAEGDTIFGADFNVQNPLTSTELAEKMGNQKSKQLQVSGTIKKVCQKKGCWLTLPLTDTSTLRVRFKNYGFFVPKDISGQEVVLNGKAYYDTITVQMRRHYARDAGKPEEEIKAINEPLVKLAFTAEGVLLKRDEQ